ncbi:Hypothetical predicted protein [Olea europaea subsp. europaea]|uniref:Uncharacterized protein n=1 Tax=Olea europaea subsp. europaea TaxID=158383 RepID=A0A8S0UT25_OLEEU|nr:Hypothetical predicted protein [Olea europaea subsp. europaea]
MLIFLRKGIEQMWGTTSSFWEDLASCLCIRLSSLRIAVFCWEMVLIFAVTAAISLVSIVASPGLLLEPFLWWRTSEAIGNGSRITRAFCWENKLANAGDTAAAEMGGNPEIVVISVIKNVDKNDLSGAKVIKLLLRWVPRSPMDFVC